MADSPVKLLLKLNHRPNDTIGGLVPLLDRYVASGGCRPSPGADGIGHSRSSRHKAAGRLS
jgi:hypothetical protein